MGELAVRPVDIAPLLEQRQDLGRLLGQDAMHRRAAGWPVDEATKRPTGQPAVCPDLAELQRLRGATQCPALIDGFVEQAQQGGLGGRVNTARDSATQPQPPFPSTNVSFTASSLQASDRRATSAFAASSS